MTEMHGWPYSDPCDLAKDGKTHEPHRWNAGTVPDEKHVALCSGTLSLRSLLVDTKSTGALSILFERNRVIEKKYSLEHDDLSTESELVYGALAYMLPGGIDDWLATDLWPWDKNLYKGGQDRIADLIRAGQFIAAEIDRLTREAEVSINPKQKKPDEIDATPVPDIEPGEPVRTAENTIEPGTGSDPATWFDGKLPEMLGAPDNTRD